MGTKKQIYDADMKKSPSGAQGALLGPKIDQNILIIRVPSAFITAVWGSNKEPWTFMRNNMTKTPE